MALSTEEIKRQSTRVEEETRRMHSGCFELSDWCNQIASKIRESDDASAQRCANEWAQVSETFNTIGKKFTNYGDKLSMALNLYAQETQRLEEEAAAKTVAVNSELQGVADTIDKF